MKLYALGTPLEARGDGAGECLTGDWTGPTLPLSPVEEVGLLKLFAYEGVFVDCIGYGVLKGLSVCRENDVLGLLDGLPAVAGFWYRGGVEVEKRLPIAADEYGRSGELPLV